MGREAKPKTSILVFDREISIDVNKLEFDFKNNRIIHIGGVQSIKQMEKSLWREAESLYRDIKSRGLQEPLILLSNNNTVIEGNCRLLCLKKLHEESKDSTDPILKKFKKLSVTCKRIVKNTPQADIDAYLAEIHVGRKKRWPEYNQARLLHKLKNKDGLAIEEIAKIARVSRPNIVRKISCYKYNQDYAKNYAKNEEDIIRKFYYFWEFMHPDLNEFREKESNIKKFMKWLSFDKFSTSKQIRFLPKVLKNKKALYEFETKNMNAAIEVFNNIDATIKSSFFRQLQRMAVKMDKIPEKELIATVRDPSRQAILQNLVRSATKILKEIKQIEQKFKD